MTDATKTKTNSWRDVIKVHPAADLFPMMSQDELKALGEDIKKNEMRIPITLWFENENTNPVLLDGRNRLDAAESAGIKVFEVRRDKGGRTELYVPCRHLYRSADGRSMIDGSSLVADPNEFVLSANVHRRHLTTAQKRAMIPAVLKAQPGKSNRTIAKQTKADHKTVGKVRAGLEATGKIPQLTKTTGADGKARAKPKKRRTADDFCADMQKKQQAKAEQPKQIDTLKDLRERLAALLRHLPKEDRMTEIEKTMKAVDLNIHDWVSTMTIGKRARCPDCTKKWMAAAKPGPQ